MESALQLVRLNDAEIETQIRLNSAIWKGPLTVEAYMHRERHLASEALTSDSGISYWGLVAHSSDQDRHRAVLSGCETIRKRALIVEAGMSGARVEDIIAHGIASVFSPTHFRHKGYAQLMMQELASVLPSWQTEQRRCLFSILYSDIGQEFYAKNGWKPFPSSHCQLSLQELDRFDGQMARTDNASPLYANDMSTLCALDELWIRKRLTQQRADSVTRVVIVPDQETMSWHHAREDFVSSKLFGTSPCVKGASIETHSRRIWCIWSRAWYNENKHAVKGNTLYILRFASAPLIDMHEQPNIELATQETSDDDAHLDGLTQCDDVIDACAVLLREALVQAGQWYMEDVLVWNPSPTIVRAAERINPLSTKVQRTQEGIASLHWFGDVNTDVRWLANDRYGWC